MTPTDDQTWIRQALERHERGLVLYAARLVKDLDRARDVTQEVFLRLCKQERSAVEGHVEVWLFTVCRNLCLDLHRKESRMTELDRERAERRAEELAGPAEAAALRDSHGRVLGLMGGLPEKQQEVLRLKFQQGLSYKEISDVTQDSLGHVGWLLHTALKSLRERMGASDARGAQA